MEKEKIDRLYERLNKDAESSGYNLNPDEMFTKSLIKGLLTNEERYGYQACPCRLASGNKQDDLDIICPCDYRDPDLSDFGTCYCALYVDNDVRSGKKKIKPVPERRSGRVVKTSTAGSFRGLSHNVWRCRVCGYLCARENPPEICPICKAHKERFEIFLEK